MAARRNMILALLVGGALVAVGLAVSPQVQRNLGARQFDVPPLQSAPVTGDIDAQTFRRIAEAQTPMVVNIRSESRRQTRDLREYSPLTPELARRQGLPDATGGAIVIEVDPRGAASRSNIRPGDVILEVNRKRMTSVSDAIAELRRTPAGGVAFLLVARDGQRVFLTLTRPAER